MLKRRVIKILRPQGRGFATVVVPIDRDRKLHSLHIWSIARRWPSLYPARQRNRRGRRRTSTACSTSTFTPRSPAHPPPIPVPSSPTNTSAPCAPMCRSTPGFSGQHPHPALRLRAGPPAGLALLRRRRSAAPTVTTLASPPASPRPGTIAGRSIAFPASTSKMFP